MPITPIIPTPGVIQIPGSRSHTIIIAASDSSLAGRNGADFVCTGINDQIMIQSAISALPTAGGSILLLEGTYNITGNIIIDRNNVFIAGQGNNTVLFIPNNTNTHVDIFRGMGINHITISNLRINGNRVNQTPGGWHYGIFFANSSSISFYNLNIENMLRSAINLIISHSCIVAFNRFLNCTTPMVCQGNHIDVFNNMIVDSSGFGIDISQSGITPQLGGIISNNYITGLDRGIFSWDSRFLTISNNFIRLSREHGLQLDRTSDCIISGNRILESSQSAHNSFDGISLTNNSHNNNIQNNMVRRGATTNQQRHGISIGTGCNNNFITNNDLLTSGANVSLVDGGTATITLPGNR